MDRGARQFSQRRHSRRGLHQRSFPREVVGTLPRAQEMYCGLQARHRPQRRLGLGGSFLPRRACKGPPRSTFRDRRGLATKVPEPPKHEGCLGPERDVRNKFVNAIFGMSGTSVTGPLRSRTGRPIVAGKGTQRARIALSHVKNVAPIWKLRTPVVPRREGPAARAGGAPSPEFPKGCSKVVAPTSSGRVDQPRDLRGLEHVRE